MDARRRRRVAATPTLSLRLRLRLSLSLSLRLRLRLSLSLSLSLAPTLIRLAQLLDPTASALMPAESAAAAFAQPARALISDPLQRSHRAAFAQVTPTVLSRERVRDEALGYASYG